jgi:tRNA(Ile)-lysidine synthase
MGGQSQGLQDFFVNLKIPAHLRPVWPLVIADQRVAWVVGLRTSEAFKITDKTRRILRLKLKKGAV